MKIPPSKLVDPGLNSRNSNQNWWIIGGFASSNAQIGGLSQSGKEFERLRNRQSGDRDRGVGD